MWILSALLAAGGGCERGPGTPTREVVVYTALDRSFSEPILAEFERRTGIRALAVYDTESTKTVGLTNRIRAERGRPRCDVFWNNEVLNTLLLKREGLLRQIRPAQADLYPPEYKDPAGFWFGFAARARVLLVNREQVPPELAPRSMFDLLEPRWHGRIGMAKPVAGTTATHVACLFARLGGTEARKYFLGLKANGLRLESGNKSCAEHVASGSLAAGWTDTDDAIIEVEAGLPVYIVNPDSSSDALGTLFLPNTLAALKDSPNPAEAEVLIDYLLSPGVEERLAAGPSAQIPLNKIGARNGRTPGPLQVRAMTVNFEEAAQVWESAQRFVHEELMK